MRCKQVTGLKSSRGIARAGAEPATSRIPLSLSRQPSCCTRTSSVVTLARPPASSSLKITNRSFRHASPNLWNKLPASLRQPCLNQSSSPSSCSLSELPSSITPSLFHSKLKHIFSKNLFSIATHTDQPDWLHGILAVSVFFCSTVFTRKWLRYVRVFPVANPSVCRLSSVVWNVSAPYSGAWTFRQCLHRCIHWPSSNLRTTFYEDRPRGTHPSGTLNARRLAK